MNNPTSNTTLIPLEKSPHYGREKILIVEDEQDLPDLLSLHLSDLGALVTIAINGHEGLRQACSRKWDVIILDIQLPGPSGLDICRKVRQNQNFVPILFLTSRATEQDRVLGLNVGADDYRQCQPC